MNIRKYEIMLILRPSLSDDKIQKNIKDIEELLKKHKGKILEDPKIEKKDLAYAIKKETAGNYVIFTYEAKPEFNHALKELLKYNDDVLRYMTLIVEH